MALIDLGECIDTSMDTGGLSPEDLATLEYLLTIIQPILDTQPISRKYTFIVGINPSDGGSGLADVPTGTYVYWSNTYSLCYTNEL